MSHTYGLLPQQYATASTLLLTSLKGSHASWSLDVFADHCRSGTASRLVKVALPRQAEARADRSTPRLAAVLASSSASVGMVSDERYSKGTADSDGEGVGVVEGVCEDDGVADALPKNADAVAVAVLVTERDGVRVSVGVPVGLCDVEGVGVPLGVGVALAEGAAGSAATGS